MFAFNSCVNSTRSSVIWTSPVMSSSRTLTRTRIGQVNNIPLLLWINFLEHISSNSATGHRKPYTPKRKAQAYDSTLFRKCEHKQGMYKQQESSLPKKIFVASCAYSGNGDGSKMIGSNGGVWGGWRVPPMPLRLVFAGVPNRLVYARPT